jgi:hypothetical protein
MSETWLPVAVAFSLAGCVGTEDGAPDIEEAREALVGENGFAANGFAANGFAANGFAANGFAANGLAANGFAANGFAANGFAANGFAANGFAANGFAANGLPVSDHAAGFLGDAASRNMFHYIVSCALPAGAKLTLAADGTSYSFDGAIGLAPEWLSQSCGPSCQRWVSACVLARMNHLGQTRQISIRGEHKALAVEAHEVQEYTQREAAYYGNLFGGGGEPKAYACLPNSARSIDRVCGASLADCPMEVVGRCEWVCAGPGRHGSFRSCAAVPAWRQFAPPASVYDETITVFLKP